MHPRYQIHNIACELASHPVPLIETHSFRAMIITISEMSSKAKYSKTVRYSVEGAAEIITTEIATVERVTVKVGTSLLHLIVFLLLSHWSQYAEDPVTDDSETDGSEGNGDGDNVASQEARVSQEDRVLLLPDQSQSWFPSDDEAGVQEGPEGTLHPKAFLKPNTREVMAGSSPPPGQVDMPG